MTYTANYDRIITMNSDKRHKIIYIAGPYRAKTKLGILKNIWRARSVAIQVWKAGFTAICPHLNTFLFDGLCEDSVWLEGDLVLLRRCDAIYMMDNWKESSGAIGEREYAIEYNIPVVYSIEELSKIFDWK